MGSSLNVLKGRQLPAFLRSKGTLADLYSGKQNGIGLIRLLLASAVVLSHSKPLGFGEHDLGYSLFGTQTNVGTLSVFGFFVLSGMLITRSARGTNIGRYVWHRCLRILPALWVCLLVSALVVAPLITLREHGNLAGFWAGPDGPLQYLRKNWWTGIRQYGIHDLFVATTPWGRVTNSSVFDGALWSLVYEMLCYVAVGILAVTGVLRTSRRFVLFLALATYAAIVLDHIRPGTWSTPPGGDYTSISFPLIGDLSMLFIVYLGFLFAVGAVLDLYRERVPVNDALGVLSVVLFAGSLVFGGFFIFGFPAFAYLLIWLSIRMPKQLHRVGRKNDYSYGVYIYGFVGQQVFASLGWSRWGFLPFFAISLAAAYGTAYLSWHLVEKHAMSLKAWTPKWWPRTAPAAVPAPEPTPAVPSAEPTAAAEPAPIAPNGASDSALQPTGSNAQV